MDYEHYFQRVQDCRNFNDKQYSKLISSSVANKKDLNLYRDCFSNHTEYVAPNTIELIFDNDSSSRYIQRDNLSAFFVNKIYEPPRIFDYESNSEIPYAEFLADFAESSFYSSHEDGFKLGSNRIRYIVGDVGQGKTAFIKRVYCDLYKQTDELDSAYKVISTYMDLEKIYHYVEKPIPLMDDFESYLFKRILECLAEADKSTIYNRFARISTHSDARLSLKYLLSISKEEKIRFLVYIDNLDFYHYYYARYCFFENGNKAQEKSIINNINWLISIISDPEALGHLGLNIIISVRSYVYDEIVINRQGVKTATDSSKAFYLDKVPDDLVVSSRVELFAQASELVLQKKPGANLQEILNHFKIKFTGEKLKENKKNGTPFNNIYKLGQHGYRSLVHFLSSLNLTPSSGELFDRFFGRQVSSLYVLYFNNMYHRYTQEKNHFPNMFLVDCTVMDPSNFPEAHEPHMHTYWLKYFILMYIYKHQDDGVKLNKILEIFRDIGGYDDHLVRHVLGSLCTANEFRCADTMLNQANRPFYARKIYPTMRGKRLLTEEKGVSLCFNLLYLRTIMDDKWLSYPKAFFDDLYNPTNDYSHLYDTNKNYIRNSINSVYSDAKNALLFLSILLAAFRVEIQTRKTELHKILYNERLIPNIKRTQNNVISSAKGLLDNLNDHSANEKVRFMKNMLSSFESNVEYDEFFKNYYDDTEAKVMP